MGGDLNFSLDNYEIWGETTLVDPLSNFFIRKLDNCGPFGATSIKLMPT